MSPPWTSSLPKPQYTYQNTYQFCKYTSKIIIKPLLSEQCHSFDMWKCYKEELLKHFQVKKQTVLWSKSILPLLLAPSSVLFHTGESFPGTRPGICSNPGNVSRRHQSNFCENLIPTIIPVLIPLSSHQMWAVCSNRGKRKIKPNPLNLTKEFCPTQNLLFLEAGGWARRNCAE